MRDYKRDYKRDHNRSVISRLYRDNGQENGNYSAIMGAKEEELLPPFGKVCGLHADIIGNYYSTWG